MRVLILLVVTLLWSTAASAQQVTVAGCDMVWSTINTITDPGDAARVLKVEYRRADSMPVEVRCPDIQVFAQEIDFSPPDNLLELRGQVVFQQGGTRIVAAAGRLNTVTREGHFETASGSLQLTDRQVDRTLFGAQEPEAFFTASLIEKIGPRTYRLTDATFTTCVQPSRRWQVMSSKLTFTVDRRAVMYNARLQVKDVSVLYLPLFYYPIQEDDRASGILMPTYGSSTLRGFTLSNAFFWAINRSSDATIYHDWYSRSGYGLGADYRYVGHGGSSGDLRVYMINQGGEVADDGETQLSPASRSYQFRGNLVQNLPLGIRVQGRADYFTDITSQQLYQSDLYYFSRRTSSFGVNASGAWGRIRATAQAERSDVYSGTRASSYRTQPRLNLSVTEAPIRGTRFYVGGSLETVNLSRIADTDVPEAREDMFRTDGIVTARQTVSLGSALALRGSASARRTTWNARRDPASGARIESPISRELFEIQLRAVGPKFTRVWNTPGSGWVERVKHVVEPSVSVMRRSAFDAFDEVLPLEPMVDLIVGNVTQVTYGISNRIQARVRQDTGPSVIRELATLDIEQTYFSKPLAASYDGVSSTSFGPQYTQLPPPGDFGPVRARLHLKPAESFSGDFSLEYDTQFKAVRSYRASATVRQPLLDFSGSWNKQQVIEGLPNYDDPRFAGHSMTLTSRLKKPGGGASLAYSTAIDILNDRFINHRVGAFYNAQCCGIAIDYVVANYSHHGLRNDKRFSISFSLAGIGSFVNPMGVFGNNSR